MRLSREDRKRLEELEAATREMRLYQEIAQAKMSKWDEMTPEQRNEIREREFY